MKIKIETMYLLQNDDGYTIAVCPGEDARLEFRDGTYFEGEISKITDHTVTIMRNGEDYTYNADEIADIKVDGPIQNARCQRGDEMRM